MQLEAIDKDGNVRPIRPGDPLADGERLHVPYAFMDANSLAARDALAQKYGQHAVRDSDAEHSIRRRGFVRGFQLLETLLPTHDASDEAARAFEEKRARLETSCRINDGTQDAAAAYNERSVRLENAWREKQQDTTAPTPPARDAAQARALADQAWQEKKERLQDAYRK